MNNYQFRVSDCINDKLVDLCFDKGISVRNVEILYHHHLTEISTLFYKPSEHYSKIMLMAYRKVEKDYKRC